LSSHRRYDVHATNAPNAISDVDDASPVVDFEFREQGRDRRPCRDQRERGAIPREEGAFVPYEKRTSGSLPTSRSGGRFPWRGTFDATRAPRATAAPTLQVCHADADVIANCFRPWSPTGERSTARRLQPAGRSVPPGVG
jgi:hypothetical protein